MLKIIHECIRFITERVCFSLLLREFLDIAHAAIYETRVIFFWPYLFLPCTTAQLHGLASLSPWHSFDPLPSVCDGSPDALGSAVYSALEPIAAFNYDWPVEGL